MRLLLDGQGDAGGDLPLDRVLSTPGIIGGGPLLAAARALHIHRTLGWILPDDDARLDRHAATLNVLRFGDEACARRAAGLLACDPRIEFAHRIEAAPMLPCGTVAREPREAQQWALVRCGFPAAWQRLGPQRTPSIGIVDSGLDGWHEDAPPVSSLMLFGLEPGDASAHGTQVAGIAAAPRNGVGVAGAAPCTVEVYKVFGPDWDWGRYFDALHTLSYSGAKVVSLSLGHLQDNPTEASLIRRCMDHGKIVVACMGNASELGLGARVYPGAIASVIAVGATTEDDSLASYSIHGDHIWLCAPGSGIYTCVPGGGYGYVSGTSYATPLVAAACSLLCALFPDLDVRQDEARDLLRRACAPINGQRRWSPGCGHGRLDLTRVLRA